ncbi:Velvet complex subunit B [Frankliniella fusca]|uniref:Velvet complex subunit B n=1 Tax=Frankliniella fusca TaxID=407009 RepID=A0AAE1H8D3_9NEOP|nr:Velvet complex subunit B [Frankliniella fusca]
MAMQALVFWMEDQKTSIVDLASIPESDREPGKISRVLWQDGQTYPAQILKLSKCSKTLISAEKKLLDKYNGLQTDGVSKRQARPKGVDPTVASAVEVARALGERIVLPPQHAAEKAAISRQRRVDNSNVKQIETHGDSLALQSSNVSSVKRSLQFSAMPEADLSGEEYGSSVSPRVDKSPDENTHTPLKLTEDSPVSGSCDRCRTLLSHINPASIEFLITLSKFCNIVTASSNLHVADSDSFSTGEQTHLRPLTVECGHKKVELTAGSGLFLKKASKSKAVFSANGDPEKLTREILTVLYGNKLRQPGISALGHGKQKLGIGETDLQNIFSFVCRNSDTKDRKDKKPFTFHAFVKTVNKKLKTASRDPESNSSAYQPPSFSSQQPPSFSSQQPPSFSSQQPPSFSSQQPPSFSSQQPPSFSSQQPPSFSSYQPPSFSSYQPPSFSSYHQQSSSFDPYYCDPEKFNPPAIPLMDTQTILSL